MAYAVDTSVPVEKSRAELERTLARYGAASFGYMTDDRHAAIAFVAHAKQVRFILPLPPISDFTKDGRGSRRSPEKMAAAREQACRARWRALCLCVKAKLEAVECGITSFEQEFLAHFMMPNGETFGTWAIPQIEEAAKSKKMPTLALMS
jgi:hypothetical protein